MGRMPNDDQAAPYSSVLHYLEAVKKVDGDDCHPREREDPEGHAAFPISLDSACTQGSSFGSHTSWPTGSPLSRA